MRFQNSYKSICVLAVLSFALLLCGCGYKQHANFESGYFAYTSMPPQIMIGVRSDKDTFLRDDVSFDLYYGFHDIDYDKKYDYNPENGYLATGRENVVLALYLGHYLVDDDDELFNKGEFDDYNHFEHHYLLNEISGAAAFSGDYGYTNTYRDGIKYRHYERITVPQECLIENEHGIGYIRIEFRAFCLPTNENESYLATASGNLDLRYEAVGDDKVKISFTSKKD